MKMTVRKAKRTRRKIPSSRRRSYVGRWRKNTKKKSILSRDKSLRKKKTLRKIGLSILVGGLLLLLAGIVVVSAIVSKYSREIPPPGTPFESGVSPQTTYIYDSEGKKELYRIYGDKNSEWVSLEEIPPHVQAAFLAAEDAEFFRHKGLDLPGIAKSIAYEVFGIGTPRGASTITQQLIQNTVGSREHSYERKLKELILSMQIESKYTKPQILEAYLNHLPFGGNIYGIRTASKGYFGKEPSELTVAEAAILAGFPQKPTYFSPAPRGINPSLTAFDAAKIIGFPKNPQQYIDDNVTEQDLNAQEIADPREYEQPANKWRQLYVLNQMADKYDILKDETGCNCGVEWEEIEAAKSDKVKFQKFREEKYAGHFVDYVKNELEEMYEDEGVSAYVEQAGFRVYTTLDWDMQQIAEEELKKVRTDEVMNDYGAYNAATIAVDPKTGEILVMAGSRDYWGEDEECDDEGRCKFNGQTNVITSLRSPGSSIKPLMYTAFFEQGYSPTTFLPDITFSFGNYKPKNYDRRTWGYMDTRYALEWSRNIPAVSALSAIGVENFTDLAGRMGYTQETLDRIHIAGLSSTIGGASITLLEHAQAYATLANSGVRHDLAAIKRIEDRDGNTIYEHDPGEGTRVVDERYTYMTTDVIQNYWTLNSVRDAGYAGRVAGKTGTNDGPRDIVFAGYTRDVASIMWAGNNDNSELRGDATGSKLAQNVWNDYALKILPKFENPPFEQPSGIVRASVCADTGLRPGDSGCGTKVGIFAEGQLPPVDTYHLKLRVSNCPKELKIASEADEIAGVARDATFVHYQHPSAMLQSQMDAHLEKQGKLPPTEVCTLYRQGGIQVNFTKPADNSRYTPGQTLRSTVTVGTPVGISEVKFYIDNNLVKTATQAPYSLNYTIENTIAGGRHTLKAVAKDTAGRTGRNSINFIVDKLLPSATVNASSTLYKPSANITIDVTNPENATSLELWVEEIATGNQSKVSELGSVSSSNIISWDISGIPNGSYYKIWAVLVSGVDRITSNVTNAVITTNPE